jgi:hypothetical protein
MNTKKIDIVPRVTKWRNTLHFLTQKTRVQAMIIVKPLLIMNVTMNTFGLARDLIPTLLRKERVLGYQSKEVFNEPFGLSGILKKHKL